MGTGENIGLGVGVIVGQGANSQLGGTRLAYVLPSGQSLASIVQNIGVGVEVGIGVGVDVGMVVGVGVMVRVGVEVGVGAKVGVGVGVGVGITQVKLGPLA